MAKKIKRGRGRPSFETSGRQKRKVYNRYKKMALKKKEKYGDKIEIQSFEDFVADYKYYREKYKEVKEGKLELGKNDPKNPTLSNYIEGRMSVSRAQGRTASMNFNNNLDHIRAKNHFGQELSDYEKEMLLAFGEDDYLKQYDIRAASDKYQAAYDIAVKYGMGDEAFGS